MNTHLTIFIKFWQQTMNDPFVLLCGPQYTKLDCSDILRFRKAISERPQLQFLARAFKQLPSLCQTILKTCPKTSGVKSAGQLESLRDFLEGSSLEDTVWESPGNALLAPISVALQIYEISLLRGEDEGLSHPFSVAEDLAFVDVQGFCVGFLTAAVLAGSRDEQDFELLATRALNLAACVGLIIDGEQDSCSDPLDQSFAFALRLSILSQQADLQRIMDQFPEVRSDNTYSPARTL